MQLVSVNFILFSLIFTKPRPILYIIFNQHKSKTLYSPQILCVYKKKNCKTQDDSEICVY